jgi:hypothetical protein
MLCTETIGGFTTESIKKSQARNFLKSRGQFMPLRHCNFDGGSGCDDAGRSLVETFTLVHLSHTMMLETVGNEKWCARRDSNSRPLGS